MNLPHTQTHTEIHSKFLLEKVLEFLEMKKTQKKNKISPGNILKMALSRTLKYQKFPFLP
jgi:hypothetical protein